MADFFEDHERRELLRFGDSAFQELLQRLHRAQTGEAERLCKQRTKGLACDDKYFTLLEQHKIYGTLEEIADLYINDEKKMVLDFSESRELAVLQRPSPSSPMEYTGLRWSLFKSPNRHLAKGQDFCYLEVMKPYVAKNGRRGWAKLSHSIESTLCPDFSRTLNVNRGQLYFCGVFFQETTHAGVLNGYFYYNVERSRIPAILAPAIMKARGKNNAELINHYAKMSRLLAGASKEQAASLAQQLKAEERCGACSNRMPKWKAKHKCHFCSAFMCKKCCKIVAKNYRVENLGRSKACFACADEYGVKITRMDDEDSSSASRSRASSNASSARDVGTPRTVASSQAGSSASSPSASRTSRQSGRTVPEPLYHHQQYRDMQRQAELLRQRSQTPAGRPIKAMSEQGFRCAREPRAVVHKAKAEPEPKPEQETEDEEDEAPVVAATLDLSYLSSYK